MSHDDAAFSAGSVHAIEHLFDFSIVIAKTSASSRMSRNRLAALSDHGNHCPFAPELRSVLVSLLTECARKRPPQSRTITAA